jgi:hypothetical protein
LISSNRQATSSGSTVDQAIQQQGGGQWRGTEGVGEGGQQDRFEDPDTTRYMAEHASGQGQQVHQQEGAERRASGSSRYSTVAAAATSSAVMISCRKVRRGPAGAMCGDRP